MEFSALFPGVTDLSIIAKPPVHLSCHKTGATELYQANDSSLGFAGRSLLAIREKDNTGFQPTQLIRLG